MATLFAVIFYPTYLHPAFVFLEIHYVKFAVIWRTSPVEPNRLHDSFSLYLKRNTTSKLEKKRSNCKRKGKGGIRSSFGFISAYFFLVVSSLEESRYGRFTHKNTFLVCVLATTFFFHYFLAFSPDSPRPELIDSCQIL